MQNNYLKYFDNKSKADWLGFCFALFSEIMHFWLVYFSFPCQNCDGIVNACNMFAIFWLCFCLWQLKRDNGLPVFDLDATMTALAQKYRAEPSHYMVRWQWWAKSVSHRCTGAWARRACLCFQISFDFSTCGCGFCCHSVMDMLHNLHKVSLVSVFFCWICNAFGNICCFYLFQRYCYIKCQNLDWILNHMDRPCVCNCFVSRSRMVLTPLQTDNLVALIELWTDTWWVGFSLVSNQNPSVWQSAL